MLREVYGYIISFSFFRPLCLLRILCYICIAVVIKGGMVLFAVSKMSVLEKCFQKQISHLWSVIKSSLKYSSVVKTVMVIVLYFVCLQTMVLNWFHVCCDPLRIDGCVWRRRSQTRRCSPVIHISLGNGQRRGSLVAAVVLCEHGAEQGESPPGPLLSLSLSSAASRSYNMYP